MKELPVAFGIPKFVESFLTMETICILTNLTEEFWGKLENGIRLLSRKAIKPGKKIRHGKRSSKELEKTQETDVLALGLGGTNHL